MENFIVSARKYRPVAFSTVVGQASITNTLKNAVVYKHIAHAYLFCGPRGVGKTTCARIFAKTINCINLGEDSEPCNVCESCLSFNESRSFNIHELDAASNNSVDDIRKLIDVVRIPPQIGKYSIYIIDEVHMLSSSAFNAFLKTLEEPPTHAIFILATTEKYKILPTILSRCQIFDFNRISVEDIAKHLEYVATKEGISAEYEGLHVIAQKADGALRDALSIFDQIVSFSGNSFTYKDVINNLNILDYDYYKNLTTAFLHNDITKSLLIFDEILNEGFDAQNFISGLSDFIRDLIVCKSPNTAKLLNVAHTLQDVYKKQSSMFSLDLLYHILNLSNICDFNYKQANNKRLHVELSLIKMCRISNINSEELPTYTKVESITSKVNQSNPIYKKTEEPINKAPSIKHIEKKTEQPLSDNKHIIEDKSKQIKIEDVSVSIKDVMKKTDVNDVENPVEVEPKKEDRKVDNDFKQEQLDKCWDEFAEKYQENEPRLFNLLSTIRAEIKTDYCLKLVLTNKLQEEIVNNIKSELIVYLREKLDNSKIDLIAEVTELEEDKNKKIIYSDSDKYKYLSEVNHELNTLRDQFKLDFK